MGKGFIDKEFMKKIIKKYCLLYLFFLFIMILDIYFWLNKYRVELGFGLLIYYVIFPLVTIILSIIYGFKLQSKKKYFISLIFGFTMMLFEYTTYSLANMITFNKINIPDFWLLIIYSLISIIGLFIGNTIKNKCKK